MASIPLRILRRQGNFTNFSLRSFLPTLTNPPMRRRRKTNACLNCSYPLDSDIYNYCPSCGQENTTTNVPIGSVIGDFLNNTMALDSRFTRSIVPFFIKPGLLTNMFNEGKRAAYSQPMRMYLVISLFYFTAVGLAGNKLAMESNSTPTVVYKSDDSPKAFNPEKGGLNLSLTLPDSLVKEGNLFAAEDSLELGLKKAPGDSMPENRDSGNFLGFSKAQSDTYDRLIDDKKITDEQLMDSLALSDMDATNRFVVRQFIKAQRSDGGSIINMIVKNLPLLMFIMLPIFALILWLMYVRRKILYIQHLIHAFHLHSFAYFVYGVAILLMLWVENETVQDWAFSGSFLLVSVYAYISFLRVYRQSKRKTFFKFMLVGGLYSTSLFLGFALEALVSFLLF